MEKGIKKYSLLGVAIMLAVLLATVSAFLIVASADDSDYEATLTVTVLDAEPTEYGGTYQEMHEKLASLMKAQTDADVTYVLMLHKDAKYTTHKDLVMNTELAEGSYSRVTIDLNGHKLTASGMNNNLYTVKGTTTSTLVIVVDGADDEGNRGQVYCPDFAGALFFTRANDDLNVNTIATAQNLEMYYTNMSSGVGNSGTANQPMIHLPAGKEVYIKNVKMTYTGEDASALEGNTLSGMSMPFVTANGAENVYIEDCEFIDTNTKGIATRGVLVTSGSKVTLKNTKLNAYYGVYASSGASVVELVDCDITATKTVYYGAATFKITDTASRASGSAGFASSTADKIYLIYGNGRNEIHASSLPENCIIQDGYTVEQANGVYTMKEDTSVEATLCTNAYGSAPVFATGDYNTLHQSIASMKPTVPTTYTIVLNKDANYSTYKALSLNANVTIKVDLNGHILKIGFTGNVYYFHSYSPTLILDGGDKYGNVGSVALKSSANLLVYSKRTTDNDNANIVINDLEILPPTSGSVTASSSVLINILAGHLTLDNVKFNYTGADIKASTVTSDLTPSFITLGGPSTIKMTDCEFVDTNTKGIRTQGITLSNSGKIELYGSKIDAYIGVVANSKANAYIENCDISGKNATFSGAGKVSVFDTTIRVPKKLVGANATTITLLYGTGKTTIITNGGYRYTESYKIEAGYKLCVVGDGKFVVSDGRGYTTVEMPMIFADKMVFQRNKEINVFGTCKTEGATIKVTLDGVTRTVTVSDGEWLATFPAMSAKKGIALSVEELGLENSVTITFKDIDVGEVWLMGGQSNADYEAYKMEDIEEYVLNADNYDNIRAYSATASTASMELTLGKSGSWYQVTSKVLESEKVSAIAYVMATRLATELDDNVTVAILDVNYPGSKIVTWLDEDIYKANFPGNSDIAVYEKFKEFYIANGKNPASTDDVAEYKAKIYSWLPSGNYNAMMACLEGFGIRGVAWMQGCSDTSLADYDKYYAALMETFRMTFKDETLPCFVMQIHPYGAGMTTALRALQYKMVEADPYSYLVTTAEEGTILNDSDFANNSSDYTLVHTSRKSPIGQRLADAILYRIYGYEQYAGSISPKVTKVEADGNKIIVTFNTEIKTELGTSDVQGFEIAGENGTYVDAVATISGNTVILVADGVSAPVSVRYGYGKMILELQDGTRLPYTKVEYSSTGVTVKNPNGGENYVFERGTDQVIRTTIDGNVETVNGQTIPIFELQVGYEQE